MYLLSLPPPAPLQAVYKTYIDVVHIQKDEASNLFTMFAAEDSQGQTQAQGAGEQLSQDTAQRNLADAPNTQVGAAGGQRRWPASRVVSPAGGVASGCNCC